MQIGGFVADAVKGNKSGLFPTKIWQGIVLHRKIDHFTDTHPIVKELIVKLRPEFGRYSAIVLDMYFDYFLATNFKKYSNTNLWWFSVRFSTVAILNYFYLPERIKRFIFHFAATNRLYKYSTTEGLCNSLYIMSVYKIRSLKPVNCIKYLEANEQELQNSFFAFFDELIIYTKNELNNVQHKN